MKDGGLSRFSMDFDVEIGATLSSARVNRRPTNDSALAALILYKSNDSSTSVYHVTL